MKLGTGLGIAALIAALIGAFTPVIGLFIGWAALAVATLAALCGDRGLSIATVVLSALVFLFLTPSLWIEAAAQGLEVTAEPSVLKIGSFIMLAAPIVGMVLFSSENWRSVARERAHDNEVSCGVCRVPAACTRRSR